MMRASNLLHTIKEITGTAECSEETERMGNKIGERGGGGATLYRRNEKRRGNVFSFLVYTE